MNTVKYFILLFCLGIGVFGEEGPIITTPSGQLQGERLECGIFCNYYSFKGIPYAEPPVGELRFRSPLPHAGWQGVRQAVEHGNICPQIIGTTVIGNEDCLFLNVYTQDLIGSRPVMVWIHGGGFNEGSGNSDSSGPDFLVQDGILLVTINYRLGILGFMSTGDNYAQGNYGMKDMVEALRWIRDNIAAFGGDPNNVTIFGESAGGVAIHFLVLSSMSNGLFHRAIAHSGAALNPWGLQPNPNAIAFSLAQRLGLQVTTSESLVSAMRGLPISQIIVSLGWPLPGGFRPFEMVPNVEADDATEPRFLTATPLEILTTRAFNHVPFMMGYNDAECLFMIRDEPMFDDSNPDNFVPILWNVPENSAASVEIANAFRTLYWNGGSLTQSLRRELTDFQTDHLFGYGIDKSVRLHAAIQEENVYYYYFTFDGDLNRAKIIQQLQAYPGAVHVDELHYLFRIEPTIEVAPTNPAYIVRSRMVRLWTNFVKYGNPTQVNDDLINVDWLPVTESLNYLNIGAQLVPGMNPSISRMNVWNDLEARFANYD